jgi:putative transposase
MPLAAPARSVGSSWTRPSTALCFQGLSYQHRRKLRRQIACFTVSKCGVGLPCRPVSQQILLRRPLESAQYVSIHYTERLADAGIDPSVGSVGDSYDNALAETVNGLFKTEVIRRRGPWRSLEAVELATLEWVDWFNNRRLLEPIGNMPPVEAEERYYAQLQEMALAA